MNIEQMYQIKNSSKRRTSKANFILNLLYSLLKNIKANPKDLYYNLTNIA